MNPKRQTARDELGTLLEKHELTEGMYVRTHGDHLVVGRREIFDSETIEGDRVRLTKLSSNRYGLSVKRHNGRWERTPFSGSMKEMVNAIHNFMQHLVTSYN